MINLRVYFHFRNKRLCATYLSSLKKRRIYFYIVGGACGNDPPQPPFIPVSWFGKVTGSPHPPRILRLVRLSRFFPRHVRRFRHLVRFFMRCRTIYIFIKENKIMEIIFLTNCIMSRCKKGTRKCVDGVCRKKKKVHHFSKKTLKRCRSGTRRCVDLKCHAKTQRK